MAILGYQTENPYHSSALDQEVINAVKTPPLLEQGIFDSIVIKLAGVGRVRAAIYRDDGGSPSKPSDLICESQVVNVTADGWQTIPIPSTVIGIAPNGIWLAFKSQSLRFAYGSGIQKLAQAASPTAPLDSSFPTIFPQTGIYDYTISIYAIYAPTGLFTATITPTEAQVTIPNAVAFSLTLSGQYTPPISAKWLVDGVEATQGETFDFQPTTEGTFIINAEVTDAALQVAVMGNTATVTASMPKPKVRIESTPINVQVAIKEVE